MESPDSNIGIQMTTSEPPKRGFAAMSPEKRLAAAAKGGKSVPNDKRSFSQNAELAVAAGRKGGKSTSPENRSFSMNRSLAVEAGRKGGKASHGGKRSGEIDGSK